MPWVQIQKASEATWDDYERVQGVLGDEPPAGLIYHAAGQTDGGQWQAVSVWESQDDFDRFLSERLMPAVEQALDPAFAQGGPPPTEWFEAKHIVER